VIPGRRPSRPVVTICHTRTRAPVALLGIQLANIEVLSTAHRVLAPLVEPAIMGILNVTPDSFSDGGQYVDPAEAVDHALKMIEEGATIIDVGGESTRPGAAPVSELEELNRVIPVIKRLRSTSSIPISIDTQKPMVMAAAAQAGADMINDVSALTAPGALQVAHERGLAICLMHMQGSPVHMQDEPRYEDVVREVLDFLKARVAACVDAGIPRERICVDPGFGFGKTVAHNLKLVNDLSSFCALGVAVLIGVSRKSTIAKTLGKQHLLTGSLVTALMAVERGASVLRVHDVAETSAALTMWAAIRGAAL